MSSPTVEPAAVEPTIVDVPDTSVGVDFDACEDSADARREVFLVFVTDALLEDRCLPALSELNPLFTLPELIPFPALLDDTTAGADDELSSASSPVSTAASTIFFRLCRRRCREASASWSWR